MKTLHPRWYQIILPGTADHKGTVGICPKHLSVATLILFQPRDRYVLNIRMSQPNFKSFHQALLFYHVRRKTVAENWEVKRHLLEVSWPI